MFSRFIRPYYQPPRPRCMGLNSRYSTRSTSFDLFGGRRFRYGNSRRNRNRRRRRFWNRDRSFYPSTITDNVPEEPEPETPEPPSSEVLQVIHVEDVDFHIPENTKAHKTDKYEKTEDRVSDLNEKEEAELVIRRGQKFTLTLKLDRPYQKDKDDLRLEFKIGRKPLASKGTFVQIKVNEETPPTDGDVTQWRSTITKLVGNDVILSVYPAVNCIIGEWDLSIETVLQEDGKPKIYEYDEPNNIYIILNPFCKDDTVYFEPQGLLDEYILNDQGCQWYGSHTKPKPRPWFFGQFEDGILDVTLHLLRKGYGLNISKEMANPVSIGRMLSKMVNSNDDNGVLVGNWSGEYSDGTKPTTWNGSVAILKEYMESKQAVKFGQCWVFSGILTTVCRAIGLPCRSVTNFESAHDTDASATIDKYFKMVSGKREDLQGMGGDSIWNFHVWNEIICKRPDLPHGYDGWQVIDATPQEHSGGVFQCGPCPLAAVKRGHLWLPHDATFVFAEVNGNVVHHEVMEFETRVASVDRKKVGRKISTKKPTGKALRHTWGGDHIDRLDITNEYKHVDGSKEEARVQETVARFIGSNANFSLGDQEILVAMDDLQTVMVGSTVAFTCGLHNVCQSVRTLDVVVTMSMVKYTGQVLDTVKSVNFKEQTIKSGETLKLSVELTAKEYLDKLKGEDSMQIEVMGKSKEKGESFIGEDVFTFDHPDIEVTSTGPFKVDEPFDVTLKVTNPLTIPLTGLSLRLEGPGIRANGKVIKPKQTTIPPMGTFNETVSLTPKKPGVKTINASLDTLELPDMTGQIEIEVPSSSVDGPRTPLR